MYGRVVAWEKRKTQYILNEQIKDFERLLAVSPDDEVAVKQYNELKKKLEIINIREAEGARIRSGQKWAQEGEKCTKYFLNLEKQRSCSITIFSLVDDSGKTIRNPQDILNFVCIHFKNLYKDNVNIQENGNHDFFC